MRGTSGTTHENRLRHRQFPNAALEEALGNIAEAGYEYVETQATAPFCPHVDVDRDDPEEFKRLVQKFGFREVTGLWSSQGRSFPTR